MKKAEIIEALWFMKHFCEGKSANIGRNEVNGADDQSDFYALGKADAYKDMANRIDALIQKI